MHGGVSKSRDEQDAPATLGMRAVEKLRGSKETLSKQHGAGVWRYLLRRLAELCDLRLEAAALHRVVHRVNVDSAFVGERVEEVVSTLGLLARLLVSEDEVDPLVQVRGHVLATKVRASFSGLVEPTEPTSPAPRGTAR